MVLKILGAIKIKSFVEKLSNKKYTQAVYTQIDVLDYNKRKTEKFIYNFYQNPKEYVSDFEKFTK
jgi:hypothetical protein